MIDDHDAAALLAGMVTISRTFRKAGQRSRERSLAGTKYGFLRHLRETDARLGELAHQLVVSAPVASPKIWLSDTLTRQMPGQFSSPSPSVGARG